MRMVNGTLEGILIASSLRLILLFFKNTRAILWLDLISLVLVFGVGILTPFASPNPGIDVFSITAQAIEFLRHGVNPYAQTYVDIYSGRYGYRASPNYWPGLFYLLAPFQILFGDLRFGYIAANLATLLALYRLMPEETRAEKWQSSWTRTFHRDHGTMLLWFLFPVSFFVLEQAWTDILLVGFSAWIAVTIKEKRWLWCGLLAGFMFGTKQYGVVLGWVTFLYILFSSGFKDAAKFLIFSAVGFFACVLPFAIWDWQAFYDNSVKLYFEQPLRNDSLVVQNLLIEMGIGIPSQIRVLPVILGSFLFVPLWFQKAKSLDLRHWSVALALVYGLIFLLVKNAFCNYYYFQAFFIFLFLLVRRTAYGSG